MSFFKVKATYTSQLEDGSFVRNPHMYLVFAHSFGDAETQILLQLKDIKGEITLDSMAKEKKIIDVVFHERYDKSAETVGMFFECTISTQMGDDEGKKPKKKTLKALIEADSVEQANLRTIEFFQEQFASFTVEGCVLSSIEEAFTHVEYIKVVDSDRSESNEEESEESEEESVVEDEFSEE